MKVVLGITGASGAVYGVRVLKELTAKGIEVHLIISDSAKKIIELETDESANALETGAAKVYSNRDMGAAVCSGSFEFDAMAIVPCSMSTLSKIASGIADNVITRSASVALKERRKIVIVSRETPLSTIHLENMLRLSNAGAIVMPASPGFYGKAQNDSDLIDFMVGRILMTIGVESDKHPRWS